MGRPANALSTGGAGGLGLTLRTDGRGHTLLDSRDCAVDIHRTAKTMADMLAFTDSQLRIVWTAADRVPVEKRGVFLERVVARLRLHRGFRDVDLDDAVHAALTGLIQTAA